jgi:hypothetical protein
MYESVRRQVPRHKPGPEGAALPMYGAHAP